MTDPTEEPDLPLDERIALLERLCADGDQVDAPGFRGDLGDAWLDRYLVDGDEDAITIALGHFHEALRMAPDHEERIRWWFLLGTGHGELARRRASLPDHDRAVAWLTRVVDELPPDDAGYDEAVVCWMTASV